MPLGTLKPFEWGTIEAKDLLKPPSSARKLVLVQQTKMSSLFADGEKPFTDNFECNEQNCPTNCPESERGANGSSISRQRRAMLCMNDSDMSKVFNFTCSLPCPAWKHALPRIVWLKNGTEVSLTLILYFDTYSDIL